MTPDQAARLAVLVEALAAADRAKRDAQADLDGFVLTLAPAAAGDTVEACNTYGDQQWRLALVDQVNYYLVRRSPVFSFYVRFANKNGEWARRTIYVGANVRRPEQAGPPA